MTDAIKFWIAKELVYLGMFVFTFLAVGAIVWLIERRKP